MGTYNIDHFELVVSDLDRALDFYRSLGIETADGIFAGNGRRRAFLNIGPSEQINVVTPADVAALNRTGVAGGGHVAIAWKGSMDDVMTQLTRSGLTPRMGPRPGTGALGKGTSVYVNDPDSNSIEIIVYP